LKNRKTFQRSVACCPRERTTTEFRSRHEPLRCEKIRQSVELSLREIAQKLVPDMPDVLIITREAALPAYSSGRSRTASPRRCVRVEKRTAPCTASDYCGLSAQFFSMCLGRLALRAAQRRAANMISEKQSLVVVGAGIAGLATAYFYKRRFPERDVLVLERNGRGRGSALRGIGRGLTGRSGGHRMPGFEADHSQVVQLLGERAALDLYRETVRVSELTDEIIAEENIVCGSRRGYWIIDSNASKFAKLEDFLAPRRALRLPEPQLYTGGVFKRQVNFNGYDAGLYFPDIASFDSPKFIRGLAEAFIRRGGKIASGVEYKGHDRCGAAGQGCRYRIAVGGGHSLYADNLVLAGGDCLTRKIASLHRRTFTVYTGRIGVQLQREDFKRISPNMTPLSGCDSDLKNNQNLLDGDFLWFSLQEDGFLTMGFGGSVGGLTSAGTRREIGRIVAGVLEELHACAPFLKSAGSRIKATVGGLNTSTNLLPIVANLDDQDGVFVIAAQSGVGLNQSVLLASALIDRFAGNARIFDLLSRFLDDQIIIPTNPVVRQATLHLGTKAGSLSALRSMRNVFNRMSIAATRASELLNWPSRPMPSPLGTRKSADELPSS
jgi:glycine/D-amino acid oxidase-like deaminating enzyme